MCAGVEDRTLLQARLATVQVGNHSRIEFVWKLLEGKMSGAENDLHVAVLEEACEHATSRWTHRLVATSPQKQRWNWPQLGQHLSQLLHVSIPAANDG